MNDETYAKTQALILDTRKEVKIEVERLIDFKTMLKCGCYIALASHTSLILPGVRPRGDTIIVPAYCEKMAIQVGDVVGVRLTSDSAREKIKNAVNDLFAKPNGVEFGIASRIFAPIFTEIIGWVVVRDCAKKNITLSIPRAENDDLSKQEPPGENDDAFKKLYEQAIPFLTRSKKVAEYKEEYNELISDFEKNLDMLDENHPLNRVYEKLCLLGCEL